MNKLLHSKTFKDNLKKWLGLYICTLLTITTVVTYSRYISRMSTKDSARVAKFAISIDDKKVCSTLISTNDNCIVNTTGYQFKPYDTLDYYFTVNTSELEVLTYLVINFKADTHFNIISLTDVTADETKTVAEMIEGATFDEGATTISYDNETTYYTISSDVVALTDNKTYKITLKFNEDTYSDNSVSYTQNEAVYVGFSATQKD